MVGAYVLLGTLGIHSIEDIRDKKITVTITLFSGILGILLHLLFPDKSIFEILFGMLPGVGILLLGWLTGGQNRHGRRNDVYVDGPVFGSGPKPFADASFIFPGRILWRLSVYLKTLQKK